MLLAIDLKCIVSHYSPAATNETKAARQKGWIVYAKKPFGSPQTVLDYLGRYTHRVALSNERILSVQNARMRMKPSGKT